MARLKIILLYFVLPVLAFGAFIFYEVGAAHFDAAMMIAGAVVFLFWAWVSTTRWEREESRGADIEQRRRSDDAWNSYYTIQQTEKHRHHH
ncbi:hypothetical protein SB861_25835 [Paraburkholderia sp. SIMBA_049]